MSMIITGSPSTSIPINSTARLLPSSLPSSAPLSLPHLKQLHAHSLKTNLPPSQFLNLLLSSSSYSSYALDYALSIFTSIPDPHPSLSNKFLRALSRSANPRIALLAYDKIRRDGLFGLDRFSFPPLLKAAGKVSGLIQGKEIHGVISKLGFQEDPFLQTGLLRVYSLCGKILDARLMFDKMLHKDVVCWSVMIDGYCQNGHFTDALQLFEEMKSCNILPDEMVLSTVISACARIRNLSYGKTIHDFIIDNNVTIDNHLQSALVTMYANCGCMDMAQELFTKMASKNLVVLTAMVSGYSRVGRVQDAHLIFNQTTEKDLVCWSAMISGYAESDQPQEAINLFHDMESSGIKPDQITMLSVISACANLGVLDRARWVHMYVDNCEFGGALPVNNALIDMYAKCGSLDGARAVFGKMTRRNIISWTSMINAFAIHGDALNALSFFRQMMDENVEPNDVTFVAVLYACSHAGFVEEGKMIFSLMMDKYNITPKHEHYGCLVDLFGRANLLREALDVVETMPLAPNIAIWGSLMAACQVSREMELGEFAAKRVLELQPDHDGALVLLSNIYARERRWQDVGALRSSMKHRGIFKERGYSRIELNNEVHEFSTADRKHKHADSIYGKLDEVVEELKLVGYTPDTSCVLVDLEEEEKKRVILWHSEKLALCYGLLRKGQEPCIRIVKNLRVCEDCHTFLKLVSKTYAKEIIVRDRTRFHHYKDGLCSCNNYW